MVLRRDDGNGSLQEAGQLATMTGAAELVNLDSSWRRCQDRYRFDRYQKPHVTALTSREIVEQREPFGDNLSMIRSELEFVHSTLQAADFCASFSDMAGIILHYQADDNSHKSLEIERPGAIWAEGVAGTNGVGTCVVERRPTLVMGRNHFFRAYQSLSCIAAPVLSADADMIGVLNVTTANPDVTTETFSLVANLAIRTAERLSNQLFLNHFRKNTIMKIGDADRTILLALDNDQRIIGANQGARDCYDWRDDRQPLDLWSIFERSAAAIDGFASSDHLRGLRRLDNQAACDATILHPREPVRQARSARRTPVLQPSPARRGPELLTIESCLGSDPRMEKQARLLRRTLDSSLPVLLLGETGVGKDTLAQVLHRTSERRNKPYVAFNCASVPESLIDSELFGYGVGAFTGAKREGNFGRLQQADGGTLFLDEIGDMPLTLQTRLLRVLESGEVSPLGAAKTEHIDINIIAATNHDVRKAIGEGRFRQDLYHRLAGIVVEIQPLRERSDLTEIARSLLGSDVKAPEARLTGEALEALQRYAWPGNIREMKFVLQKAARICDDGLITVDDLDLSLDRPSLTSREHGSTEIPEPGRALQDAERKVIIDTLAAFGGDVTLTARALHMSRATLYRKIRQHRIGSQKMIN